MNTPSRESVWFALLVSVAIAGGLFVHWPSVSSGFRGDDYPQRAMLMGQFPAPRSWLDLFDFASGEALDRQQLMDFGYLPWWTAPDLRLRMWRPLASALMAWDHQRFGLDARPQHLHSLAWYVLLVIAASRVFRRWLSLPAAMLATLLFALEEGHTVPIGWLANRSTLVATALGFLTLELHVSSREAASHSAERQAATHAPQRLRIVATALCTSLALLSGEYAFTALAYVFAYECLRPEPIRSRVHSALPVLLPTAGYLILHTWVGSDIVGSGYYLSPLREPLAYAQAAVLRIPALFADLLLGVPSDWINGNGPFRNYILSLELFTPGLWRLMPGWPVWHGLIGYAALGLGALILRATLRRLEPGRRRGLQTLALGSVLALLPAAGSLPGDRLIVAAALGVAGVAATLLVHGWPLLALRQREPGAIFLALAWCLMLYVMGPLGVPRVYQQARNYAGSAEGQRVWSARAELPEQNAAQTRVYVLATADFTTAANLPWARLMDGHPLPRSYRRLSPAVAPIDVRRSGERSLEIRVLSSEIGFSALPSLYRGASAWLRVGERVHMPGLDVTVLQVREGNPGVMRFDFDAVLEDERLWFLESSPRGLRRIQLPALGETLRLPRPHFRDLRFSLPPEQGGATRPPGPRRHVAAHP